MVWAPITSAGHAVGAACTNGTLIWLTSGFGDPGFESYNPNTDTYTPLADSPWAINSTPLVYDSAGYVWSLNDDSTGAVARYEIATDTWTTIGYDPDPLGLRDWSAAGVRGREVIVVGGYVLTGSGTTDDVSSFNMDTATWSTLAPLPDEYAELGGVWVGSLFYAYGAWDQTAGIYTQHGFTYDAGADSWDELATPPYSTNSAGMPLIVHTANGAIVGINGSGTLDSDEAWLLSNGDPLDTVSFAGYSKGVAIGDDIFVWQMFAGVAATSSVAVPVPTAAQVTASYWAPGEFPAGTSSPLDRATTRGFLAQFRGGQGGEANIVNPLTAEVQPATGGMITFDIEDGIVDPVRAFAALVRKRDATPIDPGEEASQSVTLDMPGHLSITSQGLILPPNGVGVFPAPDTVAFNWTHREYDDGDWTTATSMSTVGDAQVGGSTPWGGGGALSWSDKWTEANSLAADIIGPDDGSVSTVAVPNGADQNHYFRQWFYCPVAARCALAVSVDNYAEYYVDQVLIATYDDWKDLQWAPVDLSIGWHLMAVYLQNYPQVPGNPTGYAWSLYRPGYPAPFVAGSRASDTVHVEYQADPPGMTATTALGLVLDDAAAAGMTWPDDIVRDFTNELDSNGATLPTEPNITAEVGSTIQDFVAKLQASYLDIVMDPNDWTLHCYDFDTYTPDSGLVLAVGNLVKLNHKTEAPLATQLLVRSDGLGWSLYGSGEVQAFLSLGSEIAAGDVARIAAEVINIYGITRLEITGDYAAGVAGPSSFPWLNPLLVPGALATAPGLNMSPTERRVMALGVSQQTGQENLAVRITLNDRIQEAAERIITELKS
jgi:hypothetical protein